MGEFKTVKLDLFPGHHVTFCLLKEVTNAKELRAEIKLGKFDASFINAQMIIDEFHLLAAVTKAVSGLLRGSMVTHQVHTEIIFTLAGSKSITDALANFGIADTSSCIVVALVDKDESEVEAAVSNVAGKRVPWGELEGLCDEARLKKLYKIQPQELALPGNTLSECAVSRIAVRDAL